MHALNAEVLTDADTTVACTPFVSSAKILIPFNKSRGDALKQPFGSTLSYAFRKPILTQRYYLELNLYRSDRRLGQL